jgi:hypothetical protein
MMQSIAVPSGSVVAHRPFAISSARCANARSIGSRSHSAFVIR